MPIPPKVGEVMDPAQKWAVAGAREALMDYGYPERPLDRPVLRCVFAMIVKVLGKETSGRSMTWKTLPPSCRRIASGLWSRDATSPISVFQTTSRLCRHRCR